MTPRLLLTWTALSAGVLLAACREGAPVAILTQEIAFLDADAVTIGGEHIFLNETGLRASHLVFDTMFQWRDSADYHLRGVDLTVYNEDDGTERVLVTATEGTMDERGERLVARGNVVLIVPAEGRRLESGELHYDPELERIWSDSAFVMTLPGRAPFRGSAFESDLEFQNFRAIGPGG
jgi:LPS export ABC transporter protein LptC